MLRLVIGTPRRQTQPTPDKTTTLDQDDGNDDCDKDADSTTSETGLHQLVNLTEEEELEPWVDCIKRATRISDETIRNVGIGEWTTLY